MLLPPFLFPLLLGLQLHTSIIDLLTMFPYPPVSNALLSLIGRRAWQPTPVLLPGESHGQRSLAGCSPQGRKQLDTTEWLTHFPCIIPDIFFWPVFQFTIFSLAVTKVMLNHLVLNFSYRIFHFHSFYFLFHSLLMSVEHVNHS